MKVAQAPKHNLIQGDAMETYYIGGFVGQIDDSYVRNVTPEQAEADLKQLQSAAWAIIDELVARGEAV